MRSPRLYQVFLVASLVVAAACDSNTKAPVAPDVGPAAFNIVNVAAQCSNTQKNLISSEIRNLYVTNADKNEASKRLQTITGNCVLTDQTKLHQAGADDIAYVAFFLSKAPSGLALGHTDWAQHLNDVLLYAFGRVYGPTNKGIVASSFEQYGSIGVCGSGGCLLQDQSGSFKLRVNAGTIGTNTSFSQYLFTFAPVANSNCQHETLDFHGPCHDVAVNPFTTFPSPYVTVSACTADPEATGSLAHEFNLALPTPDHTDNASFVTLPPAAALALSVTCDGVQPDFSSIPGAISSLDTRGVFAMLRDGMKQVGNRAVGFLSPTPAYAIHVFGSDISAFCDPDEGCAPVGNVDPLTFLGNFTGDPFGLPPDTQAEKGTWTSSATPPGSITVQQSLGNLTDRVVVLSQGGGACTNCGGLQLTGTVATANPGVYPANGTLQVVWSSLEDSPTLKLAPFVLRGSDGKKIAVLSYSQVQNAQLLTFTSAAGAVTVGNWVRDVAQTFTITVDLTNKIVTLTGTGGVTTTSGGFIEAATDLKQWAAEFTGIDAGVIAVDNVSITRLQSTTP